MKFSFVMLPDYPLDETIEAITLADQLGFYGCYAADETWLRDHATRADADRAGHGNPGVVQTMLDEGAISYDGEFFSYLRAPGAGSGPGQAGRHAGAEVVPGNCSWCVTR